MFFIQRKDKLRNGKQSNGLHTVGIVLIHRKGIQYIEKEYIFRKGIQKKL